MLYKLLHTVKGTTKKYLQIHKIMIITILYRFHIRLRCKQSQFLKISIVAVVIID